MSHVRLRNMTSVYLVDDVGAWMLYRIGSKVADRMFIGSAGGHFEAGELNDPRACALRELKEELDLSPEDIDDMRLRYITHRLKNGEIRQNYYYFARLKRDMVLESTEGELHHVAYADIPALEMPVSAKHMILHYLHTGRYTDALYAAVTQEGGSQFVEMKEF